MIATGSLPRLPAALTGPEAFTHRPIGCRCFHRAGWPADCIHPGLAGVRERWRRVRRGGEPCLEVLLKVRFGGVNAKKTAGLIFFFMVRFQRLTNRINALCDVSMG
jgi:hypothetical protein